MGSWEELDHTADVGLRVEAADLGDLFGTAALGMFALIGAAEPDPGEPRTVEITARADDAAERLRDVLRGFLREFDRDGFFATDVHASDDGRVARVTATGGTFDPARHEFRTEIKGVTWHGLRVERRDDGWTAEVVFDV